MAVQVLDEFGYPLFSFTQWDANRKITIKGLPDFEQQPEIHYWDRDRYRAIVVPTTGSGPSGITAPVPNILLQSTDDVVFTVFGRKPGAGGEARSVFIHNIPINAAMKPEDYDWTENIDYINFTELIKEATALIELLETEGGEILAVSKEAVEAAKAAAKSAAEAAASAKRYLQSENLLTNSDFTHPITKYVPGFFADLPVNWRLSGCVGELFPDGLHLTKTSYFIELSYNGPAIKIEQVQGKTVTIRLHMPGGILEKEQHIPADADSFYVDLDTTKTFGISVYGSVFFRTDDDEIVITALSFSVNDEPYVKNPDVNKLETFGYAQGNPNQVWGWDNQGRATPKDIDISGKQNWATIKLPAFPEAETEDSLHAWVNTNHKGPDRKWLVESSNPDWAKLVDSLGGVPEGVSPDDSAFIILEIPYSEAGPEMLCVQYVLRNKHSVWHQNQYATYSTSTPTWHKSGWYRLDDSANVLKEAKEYADGKVVTIEIEDRGGQDFWTRPVTTAREIIDMVNAGKEVRLSFYDTLTNTGDQLYAYETTDKGVPYFRRNVVKPDQVSRINIGVQYNGEVLFSDIPYTPPTQTCFATCTAAAAPPSSEPVTWYVPKTMPKPSANPGLLIDVSWKNGRADGLGYDVSLVWGSEGAADNEVIVSKVSVADSLTGEYSIPAEGTVRYQLEESNGRKHWRYVSGDLISKQFSSDTAAEIADKVVPGMELAYLPGMEIYLQLDRGNTADLMRLVPDSGPTLPVYGNGTGAKTGAIPAGYVLHLANAGDHWQIINAAGSPDAVTYTPQNLTPEQQEQARQNINALPVGLNLTGLSVGDKLEVASVDDNGVPLTLRPEPKYEDVETFTIDAPGGYLKDHFPDGTPYNFKRVYIIYTLPEEAPKGDVFITEFGDENTWANCPNVVQLKWTDPGMPANGTLEIFEFYGYWDCIYNQNLELSADYIHCLRFGKSRNHYPIYGPITKIRVLNDLPIGTKVTIRAVRA